MHTLFAIVFIAFAVGVSSILGRFIRVPLPLLQIALGAIAAIPAMGSGVSLDPDLFLAAFVAPLLFADAWQTSKREFARNWRVIFLLAFGLSMFTVAGTGYFIDWLVPGIGLPVAFALAAVLSPTDAVAVKGIAKASPIPRQLMHVIEGEALLNDAAGLVALRFAIATALTGKFSLAHATYDLALTAAGGLLVGVVFGALFVRLVQWMAAPGDQGAILLMLALPISAFEIAEHLHFSGVLAAVGAGVAGEIVSRRYAIDYTTRLTTQAVWGMLSIALNGSIFVILGMQLPSIIARAPEVAAEIGLDHPASVVAYAVGITVILLLLRAIWTAVALSLTMIRLMRRHEILPPKRTLRLLHWTVTFAGVRGAVTLGAVLTLPLTLNDGSPFPGRDVAILLAAAVILVSLISSSAALPLLSKRLATVQLSPQAAEAVNEEHGIRVKLAQAALGAVESAVQVLKEGKHEEELELVNEAASSVMAPYLRVVHASEGETVAATHAREALEHHQTLRMTAMTARRALLDQMLRAREIDDELYRELIRELDLAQAASRRIFSYR